MKSIFDGENEWRCSIVYSISRHRRRRRRRDSQDIQFQIFTSFPKLFHLMNNRWEFAYISSISAANEWN